MATAPIAFLPMFSARRLLTDWRPKRGLAWQCACVVLAGCVRAVAAPSSVNGLYTPAQAGRGRVLYAGACAECHGVALEGGTSTPLAGREFIASWGRPNLTLDDFYYIVRRTMPKDDPGSMTREAYVDIVAFILQQNDFPPGVKELTPDPALMKTVRFGTAALTAPVSRSLELR